ncbi:MAG: zinc-finger domain-containing protein [Rhodospirillales bacterium]
MGCDGGGGPLGHPKVYLKIGDGGEIVCPYCSRRYILTTDAEPAAGN